MSDIYKKGVEVICPAVYVTDSAGEALETIAYQINQASSSAYDAYGDGSDASPSEIINYFLSLEEEDED